MKKNNKGFTLVELIIVIAIIAILAVTVAPQYLKYVEKARVTVDDNAVAELVHAAEVISLSSTGGFIPNQTFRVVVQNDGSAEIPDEYLTDLTKEVKSILDPFDYTFVSKKYRGKTVEITVTNGLVECKVQE